MKNLAFIIALLTSTIAFANTGTDKTKSTTSESTVKTTIVKTTESEAAKIIKVDDPIDIRIDLEEEQEDVIV